MESGHPNGTPVTSVPPHTSHYIRVDSFAVCFAVNIVESIFLLLSALSAQGSESRPATASLLL
jgi:PHP family Zn ribbon phosphoesterase